MGVVRRCWKWTRSFVLSFASRSFQAHGSVSVSNLRTSEQFYKRFGFRRVRGSRGNEVVLLRNHVGHELNLVQRASSAPSVVSLQVSNVELELADLRREEPDLEIVEGPVTRQIKLLDPDGNTVELFELIDAERRPDKMVYHIATWGELKAGLSEHYYMPPEAQRRFVRAAPRSALIALTCGRVADELGVPPVVVQMDAAELSIEAQLDTDWDDHAATLEDTYPHVNSPIPRTALLLAGECVHSKGEFLWPVDFARLDTVAIGP